MSREMAPVPEGVCTSIFDGCMCQLEAPHPGVNHECDANHPMQRWTDEDAARWVAEELGR